MSSSLPRHADMAPHHRRLISNWLFVLCFMLLGMIAIGGVTRLTGSGLSIMDWQPVSGIIPLSPTLNGSGCSRCIKPFRNIIFNMKDSGWKGSRKFSGLSGFTASGAA